MKKSSSLLCVVFSMFTIFCHPTIAAEDGLNNYAQKNPRSAPILINYQGVLNDNSGMPLSGTYDMVFRLFTQQAGGGYDWQEVHAVGDAITTDSAGVFNVVLNSTGGASGDLANLLKTSSTLWLEIEVQGETLTPRQQLTSAGFALSAPWSGITGMPADFSDGTDDIAMAGIGLDQTGSIINIEDSYQLPQSAIGGQVLKWNGTSGAWEPGDDLQGSSTYSAGDGLVLIGSEFSVSFAGSGSAVTVARSDHNHFGSSWTGTSNPGLGITTSSSAAGASALKGIASSPSGATSGVRGETQSSSTGAAGVTGIASGGGFTTSGVYGETNASDGAGLYGKNSSATGYGIYSEGNGKVDGDLTVNGDITISGNIINNPVKTGYVAISSAAFIPEQNDVSYENEGLYYKRLSGDPSIENDMKAIANLQLPHGAVITQVTLKGWTDSEMGIDPSVNLDFRMLRTSFDGASVNVCSFTDNDFPATGTMTDVTYTSSLINNNTVNNNSYGYLITVANHIGFKIYGVIIEYQY